MSSFNFLGTSTNNFVKNDPQFGNKDFFYAKFYETLYEKILRSQSCDI